MKLVPLVDRCIALFRERHPAGPAVQHRFDPSLEPDRIGDEGLLGLVLLQLLHLGGPGELLLHVAASPLAGLDLRFTLLPALPDTVQALAEPPGELPAAAPALAPVMLRTLLQAHGGLLAVEDDGPAGSALRCDLVLPAAPRPAQAARAAMAGAAAPPEAPLRVLLVEDHPVNAELTTEMLRRSGDIEVVLAGDGEQALQRALQQDFDVVLMDMFLPDTDGVVVARRLGRMLGDAAPPVIALTANAYSSDRDLCLEAGMVDFLTKPVGTAALVAAVRRWGSWRRRQARAAGSESSDGGPGEG